MWLSFGKGSPELIADESLIILVKKSMKKKRPCEESNPWFFDCNGHFKFL
jgi:hypothetical protein